MRMVDLDVSREKADGGYLRKVRHRNCGTTVGDDEAEA